MRRTSFINRYIEYLLNSHNKRNPLVWVFGEWFGNRACDNSLYLVNYLADNHPELRLYWLCSSECDTSALDARVQVVDYSSDEGVEVSRNAAVAVMGEGISDLSYDITNYWGNAIKVNLWHGVPWKKIGYDAEKTKQNVIIERIRKRMYNYDLFETPSDEYSRHIISAFDTDRSSLINAGLPRNTLFHDDEALVSCRRSVYAKLGLHGDARIVVYLPTFRDLRSNDFSFAKIRDASFLGWLHENNVHIIQKTHVADRSSLGDGTENVRNISNISAQELMAASDMLITDYSSCFFDYLLLDRPIVHYLYDYDYYRDDDRGLYYEKDEVTCGPTPRTEERLLDEVRLQLKYPGLYRDLRSERRKKFMTYESPDSCAIITQRIFKELDKKGCL